MFDILNAIESYLKFLLFIKFKFYVNNFLFHWWWWWMYNGHDVMIRILEIKVWGRSRLICSFLSIVFLKNFLCICSLILTSKFGYKRQSMREVETRLPLILFMVLEKLLCGVLLDTCATEAGLPGVGGYF